MRVVYLGTPAAAVPPLEALLASAHQVVAVVTRPDRPRDRRGGTPQPSPVKQAALAAALGPKVELLGPAAMGRGWRIIAKVEDAESAARALRPLLAEASRAGSPRMSVDVEPLEVLTTPR